MGSDIHSVRCNCYIWDFNSRSPYGKRQSPLRFFFRKLIFQFSLPVWGATKSICTSKAPFYFSIHAPRMESDSQFSESLPVYYKFQFTLPAWRATVVGFPYDFIVLLLFISANQEKAYFFACFFGFSSLCCLWFAPVLLILFSRW